MKKTYKQPTIEEIAFKTASLIASSPEIELQDGDASGDGMSRRGGFFDDEE